MSDQVPAIPMIPAAMLDAMTVAHAEIARLRLTDAEREAIGYAACRLSDDPMLPRDKPTAAVLFGLSKRLGGEK